MAYAYFNPYAPFTGIPGRAAVGNKARQSSQSGQSGQSGAAASENARDTQSASDRASRQAGGVEATPRKLIQGRPAAQKVQNVAAAAQTGLQSGKVSLPLGTVLDDFKNTMSALGTEPEKRKHIEQYLGVVALEAGKNKPSLPLIKHALRSASETLDESITQSLGQPSSVVREWIDAVLLQDVDFKSLQAGPSLLKTELKDAGAPVLSDDNTALDPQLKQSISQQIAASKTKAASGDFGGAIGALTQGISDLNAAEAQTSPSLQTHVLAGALLQQRGLIQLKSGGSQPAIQDFSAAAERFALAGQPEKQAKSLLAAATASRKNAPAESSLAFYKQAADVARKSGQDELFKQSLNGLAQTYAQLNQPDAAQKVLQLIDRLGA
ncbi:MAG: hypothetical protein VKJ06_03590 [Vampirovibrionales bacterium]|nr:hypothetical protein [Vampirovibrionales bacterium]